MEVIGVFNGVFILDGLTGVLHLLLDFVLVIEGFKGALMIPFSV